MANDVTMTDGITHHLNRMYQDWFLDYASYVILERAVPHIGDGFKPVQRRIMHSMKRMDDGRYNKVANIVGHTMQFHPHGDASIKDALVQLGQKDLLVDCQGNWGNIITGDDAAAGRYIEARLSNFALDVVFNPKTTEWKLSYDGRNKEPIALPVKFPLLLAQGAEGIAVGLNCKILPHNLGEICDAAISYLHGEEFHLYPDFPTGGSIDVSKYNDGQRGGVVRIRAKIEKRDSKTLAITEIPYGKTTGTASKPSTFIDSILKANEKGKIKIRNVEDLTAAQAEILIHLTPGASSDKTIDAVYYYKSSEDSTKVDFTAEDVAAGKLTITGLKANSSYKVKLWNKENLRGTYSFKTTEAYPEGYDVMTLAEGEDLGTILEEATSDKVVIVMPKNATYQMTSSDTGEQKGLTIPANIKSIYFWGTSGAVSTWKVKEIKIEGAKDLIRFYNLNLENKDNSADYIINLNKNDNIGSIQFEKCNIKNTLHLAGTKE